MQTLVYENYNKFISATETIRKMSSNFDKMEQELTSLSCKMDGIIANSSKIHTNLDGKRSELNRLSSTHSLLQKLHFMFELAPKMHCCMEKKEYNEAVKYYLQAETALERYRHFPSISAIDQECKNLLAQLKEKLHQEFDQTSSEPSNNMKMTETVHLLLALEEDSVLLANKYLDYFALRLSNNRSELDYYIKESEKSIAGQVTDDVHMDVLEFVDMACNGYLSLFSSIVSTFQSLFLSPENKKDTSEETDLLSSFVDTSVKDFLDRISKRMSHEKPLSSQEAKFLARSLDRFYSRFSSLKKVYPTKDFSKDGKNLVTQVLKDQCKNSLEYLKEMYSSELIKIRQSMATSDSLDKNTIEGNEPLSPSLSDTVLSLEAAMSESIKMVLSYLITLRQPDIFFPGSNCSQPDLDFVRLIREDVFVAFLSHVIQVTEDYHKTGSTWSSPSQLVLVLSRVCYDLDASLLSYLVSHVDEVLNTSRSQLRMMTSISDLTLKAKNAAQDLINNYVRREGLSISQLIRKSIETKDWLSPMEPRSVRSVMKRIIEEYLSSVEANVGDLYEEGNRIERSSDSSRNRRNFAVSVKATKSSFSTTTSHHHSHSIDPSLLSNIQKLFSERIEVFTSVEFSKLSVLTGITKLFLKSMIESVRTQTFSKHGLQQMQVDCFYLQMFLWKFVSDENVIHNLLDEALTSSMNRSHDPVLLDVSLVENICEGQLS